MTETANQQEPEQTIKPLTPAPAETNSKLYTIVALAIILLAAGVLFTIRAFNEESSLGLTSGISMISASIFLWVLWLGVGAIIDEIRKLRK